MPDFRPREISIVQDPQGSSDAQDPWSEFRQIEKVDLSWRFDYRHSLGKISKFFIELENKKLYATECPKCGQVWMPPRPICPDDLSVTRWKLLTGNGLLYSFSVSHAKIASFPFASPYVLAYVALDGATTLCLHQLKNFGDIKDIRIGMHVRTAYAEQPVAHPLWLMWFEPS